jgi:hypothetical protein
MIVLSVKRVVGVVRYFGMRIVGFQQTISVVSANESGGVHLLLSARLAANSQARMPRKPPTSAPPTSNRV